MTDQNPIGVLVVGSGFVAGEHIAALQAEPAGRLVGIVDTDPERASVAARQSGGARWSVDLESALAWPEVDAAIVCTPNHTHVELGLAIAAAGKHLLIEKPLATTVAGARQVVEVFAQGGLVLQVGHTHRWSEYARTVKSVIDSGRIGTPSLVRVAMLGGWIWPSWHAWMIDPAKSGGHALHNGVHLLDLAAWWIGAEATAVYARGSRQTSSALDIPDYLELIVEFAGGAAAICEISRGHRRSVGNHRDVLVVGREGVASLPWDGDAALLIEEQSWSVLGAQVRRPFQAQLEAWLAAVRGGPPRLAPEAAVNAVAMGVAAEESLRIGRPVSVADMVGEGR